MLKVQRLHSAVVALICCLVAFLNAKATNVPKQKNGVKTTKNGAHKKNHTVSRNKKFSAQYKESLLVVPSKPVLQNKPQKRSKQAGLKAVWRHMEHYQQLDAERRQKERAEDRLIAERLRSPFAAGKAGQEAWRGFEFQAPKK